MKFFCSILVVAIHVAPFGANKNYALLNYGVQQYFARIAVPFFFVASGYFLYRKTSYENFDINYTKKYVLKILRLYVLWSIVYFPLNFKGMLADDKGIVHAFLGYIRNFLMTGSYTQLWYLNASIVGALIVSILLSRKVGIKKIMIFASVMYGLGLLAQSWFGLIEPLRSIPSVWSILKIIQKVIVTTRDGWFEAFLFIGIGMLFAFRNIQMKMSKAVLGMFISFLLLLFEAIFVKYFDLIRAHDMYICLVPATFFTFYVALNMQLKDNPIYQYLRNISSITFYIHLWIATIISKISQLLFSFDISQSCLRFILTVIVSMMCACVGIKLSNCKYFKWIKKFYL